MTDKLVENWEKKNHRLSELVKDSLEGLDVWETILALGKIRTGQEGGRHGRGYAING